jgi:hypothetical protein
MSNVLEFETSSGAFRINRIGQLFNAQLEL